VGKFCSNWSRLKNKKVKTSLVSFVGLLDKFEARENQAELMASKQHSNPPRCKVGSHPATKAQVKNQNATKVRGKSIISIHFNEYPT
jgi:hypothetical protein